MHTDRYLRHGLVEGLDQNAVRATRIAVIGAGAIGNEVVKNLVLLGVGEVDVFDFDSVELHNLTRSIFLREADVGAGKASAVVKRAAAVDPNVRLAAFEGDFWRTLSLSRLARYSAAIGCVDNFEARVRLSQLCLIAGVDFINTGVDARFVTVESFPFAADTLPACYECHLPASAYQRMAQRYSCGWLRRALHAERTIPTTAITASIAGALAVQAALRVGETRSDVGRRILIDTRSGASTVSALERRVDCPGCGDFARRPRRVAAGGDWRQTLEHAAAGATAVRLSDPLIFDYACAVCGTTQEAARYIGQRAEDFDDRITRCAVCRELSAQMEIRAEATIEALSSRFGSSPVPAKYLLARSGQDFVCIDLQEEAE